jgi:protein-(glutamine-N5) methyltransferase, release factor-specific
MRAEAGEETVGALVAELRRAFAEKGIDTAGLDARLLVGGLLDLDATALVIRAGDRVDPDRARAVRTAMAERLAGRPVHRILGAREFHGLLLHLSPDTLEPRPDTETLVEAALPIMREVVAVRGACRIVDLGIGTGAVGLALVAACPQATCLGIDIAPGAVATATENAERLGLSGRYTAQAGNWLENISGSFDVIVSNPPYIRTEDLAELAPEVRLHDPLAALDGGQDGLVAYREIAAQAPRSLADDGVVLVEIGIGQSEDVSVVFASAGFERVEVFKDLSGTERVILFRKSHCNESG